MDGVTWEWVTSHNTCDVTHSKMCRDSFITLSYYLDALHVPHCVCHICTGDITGTSHVIESCHFWMSVMMCLIKPNVTRLPQNFQHKIVVLIVQYKYWKICSKHFKLQNLILRIRLCSTLLFLNIFELLISTWQKWSCGNVLYQACTSSERANQRGWPLNIFTWFIGAGGSDIYIWTSISFPPSDTPIYFYNFVSLLIYIYI